VEKDRFKGTCYKAANRLCVGQTKGTAKRGHDHLFHGKIKDVYLYPLRKDFGKKLTRLPLQGTSGQAGSSGFRLVEPTARRGGPPVRNIGITEYWNNRLK